MHHLPKFAEEYQHFWPFALHRPPIEISPILWELMRSLACNSHLPNFQVCPWPSSNLVVFRLILEVFSFGIYVCSQEHCCNICPLFPILCRQTKSSRFWRYLLDIPWTNHKTMVFLVSTHLWDWKAEQKKNKKKIHQHLNKILKILNSKWNWRKRVGEDFAVNQSGYLQGFNLPTMWSLLN